MLIYTDYPLDNELIAETYNVYDQPPKMKNFNSLEVHAGLYVFSS
jgi:hypothetical protein